MEASKLGKLLIISAPSGAGKTTLVKYLLTAIESLHFSISATSRPMRNGETNGKDYYFLSKEDFQQKINENAFLEWEEVYEGVFYGTLYSEVERITSLGYHVVFDVDVIGGLNIKKHYGSRSLSIFIQAPSIEVLADRLRKRCTDSEESIKKRIEKAASEMKFASQFDLILVNDDLGKAKEDIVKKITKFINEL
jgi:guanylate kinase